ncbi:single-stranded-DNA-specific exonuclease RecJ [Bacillus paramycoides]|uniref:single-stranded-DNA-specific exonuclease RecJ n=1 Tax=Bacillus paramycoides TaxID=2026194 RepID=UPI003B65F8C9
MNTHHLSSTSGKWIPHIQMPHTPPNKEALLTMAKHLNIHPIFLYHLHLHGYEQFETIERFLVPNWEHCHSPFLLQDMKKAVYRIFKAIQNKENIMIFGDYDADGITSSTLLYKGLKKLNANVTVRLPIRSEGYGLSAKVMNELPSNISLIITVDNGSSAHEAMQVAKQKGVDVIVTDHHDILQGYPDCYAFINPKRNDDTYPFPFLAGAGVALKVVQALFETIKQPFLKYCSELIELATIGTIADLMPLKDENRIICSYGLKQMNSNPSPALKTLFKLLKIKTVDSSTIGFQIGPLFNATGRIADPNITGEMLRNNETDQAKWTELLCINNQRKQMTKEQFLIAEETIFQDQLHKDNVIVVWGDFHPGIIGLISSRISEKYKKPSIVISNTGTGSARSVNKTDFSIVKVIQDCGDYLKKYGGHRAAAGLSIPMKEQHLLLFRSAIQKAAKTQTCLIPPTYYLSKLSIGKFSEQLFHDLYALEPFGMNNPKPVFLSQNTKPSFIKMLGEDHLLFGISSKCVFGFQKGDLYEQIKKARTMHCLYTTNCYHQKNFLIQQISL